VKEQSEERTKAVVGVAGFARRHADALGACALYATLFLAWNAMGGAFHVWPDLWQLLPWPSLVEDLSGAMLDLHSQPPFLNLLFGLALQASIATGLPVESLLQPVYFAVGGASVATFAVLARRLVSRPAVRWIVVLLFVANPYLYASLHYVFYTPWEMLFLLLSALLCLGLFERPAPGRLAAALAPAILLVYTRSLFHPIWFVGQVVLLAMLARPALPWRRGAMVASSALFLVAAWPMKNLARFGFFGFSSWSGMSIARGLPTGEPLLPSGYQARLGAFARTSNEPPAPGAVARAERLVPSEFRDRPVLASVAKPDGSPNWNHYALIPLSRELGAAALATLREDPSLLLMKGADFYANGFALFEARWPYKTGYSPEMTTGQGWAKAYEMVVFLPFRDYDPAVTRISTGFAILFPLIIVAALVALWRRRRGWNAPDRTVALMLFSIGWVLAMVLFVDGPEGNRVRYSTEPFLFLVAGWLVVGRRSGGGGDAQGVQLARRADGEPSEDRLDQE
jgi:hypothetical protein